VDSKDKQNKLLYKELLYTKTKETKKTTILGKSSYQHKTANDDIRRHSPSACHIAVGDGVV
jgi:hypothetical protein